VLCERPSTTQHFKIVVLWCHNTTTLICYNVTAFESCVVTPFDNTTTLKCCVMDGSYDSQHNGSSRPVLKYFQYFPEYYFRWLVNDLSTTQHFKLSCCVVVSQHNKFKMLCCGCSVTQQLPQTHHNILKLLCYEIAATTQQL